MSTEDSSVGELDKISLNQSNDVTSAMPGKVLRVEVKKGDTVKKGDLLLVVESMKMENSICCVKETAIIDKVNVSIGQMVDTTTPLIVLKENN
ncbi:MAG: biotin/lipoyl-containing protein [Bacteroidales bacterium]